MNFTLGLFDLFTHAVPGSLYLAIFVYVAETFDWVDVTQARDTPSVLLIITIAVASFLLGHVAYPLAEIVERVLRLQDVRVLDARRNFVAKYPGSAIRPFLRVGFPVLLAAVELHDKEVATEITRLRATGLMLRSSSLALIIATVVSIIQLSINEDRFPAAICAILLTLTTVGSYWQGQTLRHWANNKTLEICSLIPDIDDKIKLLNGEPLA
jgi:hypothetical protein